MREIKFRALKDDMSDCSFVYGDLIYDKECVPRIHTDKERRLFTTCIKGTVGQFTGLVDKNGVDIYEGDEVQDSGGNIGIVKWVQDSNQYLVDFYDSGLDELGAWAILTGRNIHQTKES